MIFFTCLLLKELKIWWNFQCLTNSSGLWGLSVSSSSRDFKSKTAENLKSVIVRLKIHHFVFTTRMNLGRRTSVSQKRRSPKILHGGWMTRWDYFVFYVSLVFCSLIRYDIWSRLQIFEPSANGGKYLSRLHVNQHIFSYIPLLWHYVCIPYTPALSSGNLES